MIFFSSMAFRQFGMFALFAILTFPCLVQAAEWVVGDGHGWTIHEVNYTEWAQDKIFKVGDKLIFNYNAEFHNVLKVNQHEYQNCTIPSMSPAPPVTGHDVITLTTPGMKWYICGRFTHCVDYKQKLAISVLSDSLSVPAPAPSSSNRMWISARYMLGIVATTVAAMFLLH